ncbi:MAG TPA: carboxypeptidase-like regulatory domain-containing protein [Granulicella sp.]
MLICLFVPYAFGQQISAPEPQAASLHGIITDTDGAFIPGAAITASTDTPADRRTSVSGSDGVFAISGLRPAVPYHLVVSAKGFADWTSPAITLTPGQQLDLTEVKLTVGAVETSVTAVTSEQLALEQVETAEHQRVLGVIPNFYVAYDKQFVPLSAKLKYQLAYRASTDVVSVIGAAFIAGIDQASASRPNYVQGAKGYGQRFGAAYAQGISDILIGGAVLPSLLHQDPRYFYQGTGTTKSRMIHALEAPFVAKGDNGRWQFNYSSIGGDLATGALANTYYPNRDRGVGLVFTSAAITTGGRIANALAQEFFLSKYTTRPKKKP